MSGTHVFRAEHVGSFLRLMVGTVREVQGTFKALPPPR